MKYAFVMDVNDDNRLLEYRPNKAFNVTYRIYDNDVIDREISKSKDFTRAVNMAIDAGYAVFVSKTIVNRRGLDIGSLLLSYTDNGYFIRKKI